MNGSDSDGPADGKRKKALVPLAMMFVAIGMMFVVLYVVSPEPHGRTEHGFFGADGLGHRLLIGLGIGFEAVGLVLAVNAAAAAKKN
jgi:hypothetical protein